MNLIQLVTAGFKRAGVIAYNLQQAINTKQDKLPTNGTSGQFLAHDLTFKTPSGGGGSSSTITWTNLPVVNDLGTVVTGFSDGTQPLQIGKDSTGLIWLRGAFRVTSGTIVSGSAFASLPTTHMLKGFINNASNYIRINSCPANFITSNQLTLYTQLAYFSGVQSLSFSSNLGNPALVVFAQQCLGHALNP